MKEEVRAHKESISAKGKVENEDTGGDDDWNIDSILHLHHLRAHCVVGRHAHIAQG